MSEDLKIPQSTLDQQFKASDPKNSSWLSANAGSGKTHVLTQRVIRLMLDGSAPDKIMCLTFTKAAAANMKNRVFQTLAEWTMLVDKDLNKAIKISTGTEPSALTRETARQLFAKALDTPGGLKIQTIHGFCESLLHQFPLEANVPGHFDTVQELQQSDMISRAISEVLSGDTVDEQNIIQHYEALIPYASDTAIENGINGIVQNRENFLQWADKGAGLYDVMDELYNHFEISRDDTRETLQDKIITALPVSISTLRAIVAVAQNGTGKSDGELVERLSKFLNSTNIEERFSALCDACLTKSGTVKAEKSIATKSVKEKIPDLVEHIQACGNYLIQKRDNIHAPELLKCSYHIFELGLAVLKRYQTMKRQRGIIDFDDQIERTANLLNRSEIRDWIRYRLDRGVDHVLVDEAQDTSPRQWEIINAITDDFYSGSNASSKSRTVFVVGDEKQSIFSFQGAEPTEFNAQRQQLAKRVNTSEKSYHPGNLTLSFRSTEDVLKAVDKVFDIPENRKGLTGDELKTVHDSVRETHPGEVQIWPLYKKSKGQDVTSWLDPVDHAGNDDPAILLAKRISSEIKTMVGNKLPGMDRPLQFKDILVLVRSRNRFITALTRTMKDDGLAIAGADRLKLTEHIAVEDMLAIGRAAILPQDDLSLACSLKSLFFNIDEETLFAFAYGRGKERSLYEQILHVANDDAHENNSVANMIVEQFKKIENIARNFSAFEFYARLLGEFGGRKQILMRLGSEAEDVIDAFLDESLTYTRESDGRLEGFLSEITRANPEIKREVELDRDEVRILTVHASKGLEAPVVFLVDSCGAAWRSAHAPELLEMPSKNDFKPFVWLPSSKHHTEQTKEVIQQLEVAANAEYRRLLYVGMTRAADRLFVCGYHGIKVPNNVYWHKMVHDALADTATEINDENGNLQSLRWVAKEKPAIQGKTANPTVNKETAQLPDWLFKPAKSDPPLPRPLSPSGASVLIDVQSSSTAQLPVSNNIYDNEFALKKGNVTHKLLEILPEFYPEEREVRADQYLDKVCTDWPISQKETVKENILAILNADDFKHLFSERAMAEVSVAGWVETGIGKLQISGQVDRLIVSEEQVIILDYKTNHIVPDIPEAVHSEYKIQLALYRELVRQIYPQHKIVSALMWTQVPKMMVLPDEILNQVLQSFKNR